MCARTAYWQTYIGTAVELISACVEVLKPDPRMANRSAINAGSFYIIIIIIVVISNLRFLSLAITHTQLCILPLRRQVSDFITFFYCV
jgi:hypothetical protein